LEPAGGLKDKDWLGLFRISKNSGPEGPALIIPRGDLVCRHLTIYGVLEYWSDGVMEETPFFIALSENISLEKI